MYRLCRTVMRLILLIKYAFWFDNREIFFFFYFQSLMTYIDYLRWKYWLFIYYAFENKKLRKKRRKHENISRKVNFVSETAIQQTQHKKAIYFYVFFLFLFLVMTWFVVFIRNLSVIYVKLCQWTDMSLAACFNKKKSKNVLKEGAKTNLSGFDLTL